MKNYICINEQKIALTDEQISQLKGCLNPPGIQLADVPVGEVFKIGNHEFVVLEHSGDTTAVILKGLLPDQTFGESNNYNGSHIDTTCNKFAEELETAVGKGNLCLHTVDLTSDDGLKDYGEIQRRASLLTAGRYRKYVEVLDKHKIDAWWWLATPHSTRRHENDSWIKCVAPSGIIYDGNCSGVNGVRPFCILKSTIFVSD